MSAPTPKPHKHAALIKQWADDPSQPVWIWSIGYAKWIEAQLPYVWSPAHTYALGPKPTKPPQKMCVLAGVEFPMPETEAPEDSVTYWAPDVADPRSPYFACTWGVLPGNDLHRLGEGLVHLTREAAEQHSKALLAANKQAIEAAK